MITVNQVPMPYKEGMTIRSIMEEKGYCYYNIIVKVNGQVIHKDKWPITVINDGDVIQMLHIFSGG